MEGRTNNAANGWVEALDISSQWVGLPRLRIADAHPRFDIPADVPGGAVEDEPRAVSVVRAYRDRLLDGHEMLPAEALRVRPDREQPGHYEIFDGALRFLALAMAGRERALVAVERLSDAEVYRAMMRADNRANLSPFELGLFLRTAIRAGALTQARAARELGLSKQYIAQLVTAAEVGDYVAEKGQVDLTRLGNKVQHLAAIREEAPSKEHWPSLVQSVVEEGWTAKQTRSRVRGAARGKEDDGPEPVPEEPLTCSGEVIILGDGHRLLCGDATILRDVRRLRASERAAAMWTDPPYGVRYVGKTPAALKLRGDCPDSAPALLADALVVAAAEALVGGAPYYIAHPAGALAVDFGLALRAAGWRIRQTLMWGKDRFVLGHSDYHYRHEPIYYGYSPGGEGRRGRGATGWHGGDDQDTVFEVKRPAASHEHPTMKPVTLIERQLLNSTGPGDTVYDPFAGSGGVLVACENLGRRAFLIELDPGYCDVLRPLAAPHGPGPNPRGHRRVPRLPHGRPPSRGRTMTACPRGPPAPAPAGRTRTIGRKPRRLRTKTGA